MKLNESEAFLNCFYNNNIAVMELLSFGLFEAKGPLAVKLRKWGRRGGQTDRLLLPLKLLGPGIFCCMAADWDIGTYELVHFAL